MELLISSKISVPVEHFLKKFLKVTFFSINIPQEQIFS